MSEVALRVLPYDETENDRRLFPARLVRPAENGRPALQLLAFKGEIAGDEPERAPRPLSRMAETNGEPPTFPDPGSASAAQDQTRDYSPALIRTFAIGAVVVLVGLLLLVLLTVTRNKGIGLASASCLVIGTSAVALSLLRGQDLEESVG